MLANAITSGHELDFVQAQVLGSLISGPVIFTRMLGWGSTMGLWFLPRVLHSLLHAYKLNMNHSNHVKTQE